ncbi:MAG: DNA-processing protein DprA [Candidatus Paceibacterota bacterium]
MDFDIKIISINDKNFPRELRLIKTPPKVLYYSGRLPSENEICLAIVGSRIPSLYGRQVCSEIGSDVAMSSATIVSGLAKGIDSLAHECAVRINKRTIAVLGSGIDKESFYPKENLRLAQEMLNNDGLIISEYPPGYKSTRYSFPERNRIIAGLSKAVIVIEAKEKSGSLITANIAKLQKKKVFAVPNSIYSPNSRGCNELIKNGAKLVTCGNDIFESLKENDLPLIYKDDKKIGVKGDNDNERKLLEILEKSQSPLGIEKLIKLSKMSPADAISTITILEIKNKIIDIKDRNYSIK